MSSLQKRRLDIYRLAEVQVKRFLGKRKNIFCIAAKNFTYANYKIRLTAVMLDSGDKALEDTRASDYIIYTNARVVRELVS